MLVASSLVLVSCCGCVSVVERLTKEDPGCANLLTFSSFLFVALEGLLSTSRFFTIQNRIPLRSYANVVALFFLVNVVNNQALGYNIPMPLHIIFRSGSLVSNLLLGKWLLAKTYSWRKYASVFVISAGIVLTTWATFGSQQEQQKDDLFNFRLAIGVLMLVFALVFSSLLGIYQEKLYRRHGKHPREAMFYVHALGLPCFLLFYGDIAEHVKVFTASELWRVPFFAFQLPWLWLLLLLNCVLQYFCIRFVYHLTAYCSTLTVTFVITIRKFLSLLISIMVFKNPFTLNHWIGTLLVFVGSILFADSASSRKRKNL